MLNPEEEETNGVDMETPDIPSSMSSKDMSSFSQVVFPEISDYFPPGNDIQVTYVLTDALQPSSRDWIGLFQVGWTSAREYLTFVWAPKPKSSENETKTITATFSAYYLPKDKNEFYQFCYVTRQGHVRGASTPFQFRLPSECDQLIEVEDESGMIMLKTKSAVMEERVNKLTEEKKKLEGKLKELEDTVTKQQEDLTKTASEVESVKLEKESKEADCANLEKEIKDVRENLLNVEMKLKEAEEAVASYKKEMEAAETEIAKLKSESCALNDELTKVKSDNEKQVDDLMKQMDEKVSKVTELEALVQEQNDSLEKKKVQETAQKSEVNKARDDAKAKAQRYKEEKDLYKNQLAHSEEARREIMQQFVSVKEKLKRCQAEVAEKIGKLGAYEEKTRMLKNALKDAEKQNAVQKSVIDTQLSNIEDKLNACEASKRLISDELTEARDNRDKLMADLHQANKEKGQMTRDLDASRRQLSELEKIYIEMVDQVERCEQRLAEKEKKLADEKVFAKENEKELQEQITVLKSQLESADMEVAKAASSDEKHRSENGTQTVPKSDPVQDNSTEDEKDIMINDLKVQIEDLRTRLSMGAAAYTEKYMECHKLERKVKKMQTGKTPTKNLDEDSTTTDSQDDSKRDEKSVRPKTSQVKEPAIKEEEAQSTGNFMSRLEQIFMAIADPDVEEQERANRLKSRMEELEKNVQFQHDKYRKYKQRYYDEKQCHVAVNEKQASDILALKCEVDEIKKERDTLKHENEALKAQLNEFIKNSSDENIVKTRTQTEIIIPTRNGVSSITRSGYPHGEGASYPHENLFAAEDFSVSKDSSSDTDLSGEFQLASSGFTTGLGGLCPKNHATSEESDPITIAAAPETGVIKRQPTRSPPMIEVISMSDDSNTSNDLSISPPKGATANVITSSKNGPRPRRRKNDKKRSHKKDYA